MRHHLFMSLGLLCLSSFSLADWLPNPDKWLREQCHQRITQQPNLKLSQPERQQACNCMVSQAKSELSARDLLNLARLSEAELTNKYTQQTKTAFERCQKQRQASIQSQTQ